MIPEFRPRRFDPSQRRPLPVQEIRPVVRKAKELSNGLRDHILDRDFRTRLEQQGKSVCGIPRAVDEARDEIEASVQKFRGIVLRQIANPSFQQG
jgi:hypothetical protein